MWDFDTSDDVKIEKVTNSDGSVCLRVSKPDGSHAVDVVGIRKDKTVQRFPISPADAAALDATLDASGFLPHIG